MRKNAMAAALTNMPLIDEKLGNIAAVVLNDVRKNGKKSDFEEEKHEKTCKRKCQLGRLY
ncbi:hypothetical protein ACTQ1O_05360 [Bilifractor sp. LCP21S3_A7]|jgi:hypothetical protein|uniref:hypothetical protein n=1 Tax=Bilifractor sp. LCP21S3_A7 TaxID=3438738 RepID=UPI003F92BB1A